jgi:TolB-like protein/Flp pilus assembly protein TadD
MSKKLGHYEIIGPIGSGGMGEVYRARDTKLGRDVAIKVLPEEVASDRDRLRRFEQEARAASALNHPNIITIHDIAEEGSTRYIVMEYVEGKTLREMLGGRPLPTKKLLHIAPQIADGLAKAHAAGIVHRDLKPDNLMVSEDGFVKILDFGLAKLAPLVPDADSEAATMTKEGTTPGAVMGTVGYMSPEQAKAVPADYRSDQFSMGAILYEMATGQRAFQRDTAVQTLSAIIESEPKPLAELSPSLPSHLRAIVMRCLSKDPHERYDSTRDLARDLRSVQEVSPEAPTEDKVSVTRDSGRLKIHVEDPGGEKIHLDVPERTALLPLVCLALTALAVAWWFNVCGVRDRFSGGATAHPIQSVAVLPLQNLSGDPEQEYFADGMTEALIADLAKIGALKVISRTSAMRYKGSDKPLPEIAGELGVDAVVEGSVLRADDEVRITAQLMHAATDEHLWAESYQRELRDILALQSEVAGAVAQAIQVAITPEEQVRLASTRSVDPEAHEAYLKGRHYSYRGPDSRAVGFFEQAVELDPNYASAHAALASIYAFGLPAHEFMPKARATAIRALELDETSAEAQTTLAVVKFFYDWDWSGAVKDFRRASELDPNSSIAHHRYAHYLWAMEQFDEATEQLERAQELDPLSLFIKVDLARTHYFSEEYDQAIEKYQEILDLDPDFYYARLFLGITYEQVGKYEEAMTEIWTARARRGDTEFASAMENAYVESGYRGALRVWAEKWAESIPRGGAQRSNTSRGPFRIGPASLSTSGSSRSSIRSAPTPASKTWCAV